MSDTRSEVSGWIHENARPLKGVTTGAGFEDLTVLRDWIGAARVVGLGEATHGTREFFQLKHRIFEYLVSELGFTLFTIEADFPQSLAINRYVLTGEGDARHSLNSMRYWDTEEVLDLIEWMRRWNAVHERKVYFYGVDAQSTAPAIFLLEYLQHHDPNAFDRVRDALLPLVIDANSFIFEWWVSIPEPQARAARVAIEDAVATLAAMKANSAQKEYELGIMRLHAAMLQQNAQQWENASTQNAQRVRDRAMANNVAALLELHGPDSKAVFWAHNGHVQLHPGDPWGGRTPPSGQHLRERFGRGYFVFGFAFDHGSFEAPDETYRKHEWSVSSLPGTLDAALAEAGPPLLALDLRTVPQIVANWFAQGPASRCIGGGFRPSWDKDLWTRVDVRQLFDALLFVRETAAARPNPAVYDFELRREEPPAPEGWVNLDFSRGTEGWRMRPQSAVGAYRLEVVREASLGQEHGAPGGPDYGQHVLEISRAESLWPWDNYTLLQTASAVQWQGQQVTVCCKVSMQAAHLGSSAQLAVRVLKRRAPSKSQGLKQTTEENNEGSWVERLIWQRAVTRDSTPRELSLTLQIPDTAETLDVGLLIAGDGRARFGPITIQRDRP